MNSNRDENRIETIEIETRPSPSHSIIWLHGLGADGNDFVPVVKQLRLPNLGIRFIFPHAPMMPVTINGGFVMRAWYDILETGLARTAEDERGLRASQARINVLLEKEADRGVPPSRVVIAGFSQGGAMALQTGLRYPGKLAGIMVLSGYLPLASTLSQERSAANQTTPIFMAHGIHDDIVPESLGTASRDMLRRDGYDVEWHHYPMMHNVCDQELVDVSTWLSRILL